MLHYHLGQLSQLLTQQTASERKFKDDRESKRMRTAKVARSQSFACNVVALDDRWDELQADPGGATANVVVAGQQANAAQRGANQGSGSKPSRPSGEPTMLRDELLN